MNSRGSASIWRRNSLALLGARDRADQHPVAAAAVDGLDDELVEVLEDVAAIVLVDAEVGRHVAEDRLLAEVVADHLRHVAVDGLVVGDARAGRVRERDVAGAVGVEEPGRAEHRVLAEDQRVEELVVDAAVDHVDALQALRRAHVDDVVVAQQVAALDELDAHVAGEERVLEVGRVVHAGREQHDRRHRRRGRRDGAQRGEQLLRVLVDAEHAVALEERRELALHRRAVLEHVARARGRAQVVLEHEVLAVLVAHDVDAGDVRVDAAGRVEADHLAPEVARAEHELGRDPARRAGCAGRGRRRARKRLSALHALDHAALDVLPLVAAGSRAGSGRTGRSARAPPPRRRP